MKEYFIFSIRWKKETNIFVQNCAIFKIAYKACGGEPILKNIHNIFSDNTTIIAWIL